MNNSPAANGTDDASARPVHEGLFDIEPDGAIALIGGWSPSSGRHHFPLSDACPYSGATDVERIRLPRTGRLSLWTAVNSPPPGYRGPTPYGFGVVELDGIDLCVIGRLTESDPAALHEGQHVELVADVVDTPDDGAPVVSWAFAAVGSTAPGANRGTRP